MKKLRLEQQHLMDRKQLKNCTWPTAFAEKVVEPHLPPLALLESTAAGAAADTMPTTKEQPGQNSLLLAVHRGDTYHT